MMVQVNHTSPSPELTAFEAYYGRKTHFFTARLAKTQTSKHIFTDQTDPREQFDQGLHYLSFW